MKFKYILFDWDGTLAKTLDVWISAYRHIANEIGVDITSLDDNQVVKSFFGKEAQGFEKFGIKVTDDLYVRIKKYVDDKVSNVEIYPHVKQVLEGLVAHGCKLGLHTSSNKNILYPAIVNQDLEKYFDLILTRDDVLVPKPDPQIIYKELEYFNATKSEALVVGDSRSDTEAAKNAGVDCVLYYPEENKKFYSNESVLKQKPNFIAHDLIELLEIIK